MAKSQRCKELNYNTQASLKACTWLEGIEESRLLTSI